MFGRWTGLTAAFTLRGDDPPLTGEESAAVPRVVQEALHNVEKHAGATRVRVELEHEPATSGSQVSFLVADDGRGFDPADPHSERGGGFGLTSMQERIRLVESGSHNREIAERLVVTEKTIEHHLGQAYAKLDVDGRTEAVPCARELGLLSLDALTSA